MAVGFERAALEAMSGGMRQALNTSIGLKNPSMNETARQGR